MMKTKWYKKSRKRNITVDDIFMKIRDLADAYLLVRCPEEADPDLFIAWIENEIDKYYSIVEKEVLEE